MKKVFKKSYIEKVYNIIFQKKYKDGRWEKVWSYVHKKYKHLLSLSRIQLDGTRNLAKRDGKLLGYRGRKKARLQLRLLFQIARVSPRLVAIQYLGNIMTYVFGTFSKMISSVHLSGIREKELLLNTYAGFDLADFRLYCCENEIFDNIDQTKETETLMRAKLFLINYFRKFVLKQMIYTGKVCFDGF